MPVATETPTLTWPGALWWGSQESEGERGWGPGGLAFLLEWVIFNPVWDQLTGAGERRAARAWAPATPPHSPAKEKGTFLLYGICLQEVSLATPRFQLPPGPKQFPICHQRQQNMGQVRYILQFSLFSSLMVKTKTTPSTHPNTQTRKQSPFGT